MDTQPTTKDLDRFRDLRRKPATPRSYVVLLGLDYFDLPSLLKAVEKGFAWKTFERFVRNIGLPAERIADIIGIPRRTLARRKVEGRLKSDESDRAAAAGARVRQRARPLRRQPRCRGALADGHQHRSRRSRADRDRADAHRRRRSRESGRPNPARTVFVVITAWRIVQAQYADEIFSGEGARLFGARWHRRDIVSYTPPRASRWPRWS